MLSKEEVKELRVGFWLEFDNYSIRKKKRSRKPLDWIMNDTGIKQLKLKFDFDEKRALVGIDIETRNLEKRIDIYGKVEGLRNAFETALGQQLKWELDYMLPTGKSISRAYLQMPDVSIYRREDWPAVMDFFYKNMLILEKVFEKNKDHLKFNENNE